MSKYSQSKSMWWYESWNSELIGYHLLALS